MFKPDDRDGRSFQPRMSPVAMVQGGTLIDPLYLLRALWNSQRLIAAMTLLGLVLAGCYAFSTPKIYVATTQILLDPRDLKVVQNEVTPNGLPSEATLALVESQSAVIMSNSILSRVVDEAHLTQDPEFGDRPQSGLAALLPDLSFLTGGDADKEIRDRQLVAVANLRKHVEVARDNKSFVLNLAVTSEDPEKAANLANTIAKVFLAEQGRVQSDAARRATDALQSRLAELRNRVVDAERKVEEYKAKNQLIGVGGKLVDDAYITRINDQLATARAQITALRVKADSLKKTSVDDVVKGAFPEEQTSDALVRLRATYSDLAQQAAALRTKLGPRHPQRIAAEQALESARNAIRSELQRIVSSAQTELARAEQTEEQLAQQIDELKAKQVTTSGAFVRLRELEREVEASRAVYESFLLRARETGEQESLNTANVRVISEATPPLQPAGMSRKLVVLLGAILGFAAGVALAAFIAIVRLLRSLFSRDRRGEAAVEARAIPSAGFSGTWSAPISQTGGFVSEIRPSVYALGDELRRPGLSSVPEEDGQETAAPAAAAHSDAPATSDAEPEEESDRETLRRQIRAIADGQPANEDAVIGLEPEVARLQRDIDSVKGAIAAIRRRRRLKAVAS